MILSVSTTPELFRTSTLAAPISWSETNQLDNIAVVPAGGGTNVATALFCAGKDTKVLLPAPEVSHYVRALSLNGVPYELIDVPGPIPVRYLIDSPDSRQLQFVDPPMALKTSELAMLRDLCISQAENADWVVLSGVLPDVAHAAWYVDVMRALRLYHPGVRIAVSTSGDALGAVLRQVFTTKPDLLVMSAAEFDDEASFATAVRTLQDAEVPQILVCHDRQHFDYHSAGSTVSGSYEAAAGKQWLPWIDFALTGLLLSENEAEPGNALISALAWANAEIGDPLRAVPTPDALRPDLVTIVG